MSDLKNMNYISKDIGGTFKSSKHQYIWEFTLDDKRINIQFFVSKLSDKRKIIYNQKVIREEESKDNSYSYEFVMDGHNYKISQNLDTSDLLIDGGSFEYFYNLEKSRNECYGDQKANINSIISEDNFNENQSNIQRLNEINFIKQEKPKQILNFSFKNNYNNNTKSENNLRKFKFGENNSYNNNNNNFNMQNNNNKRNNLIDFDDFNNNNQMNNNLNFGNNKQIQGNNYQNNYFNNNSSNSLMNNFNNNSNSFNNGYPVFNNEENNKNYVNNNNISQNNNINMYQLNNFNNNNLNNQSNFQGNQNVNNFNNNSFNNYNNINNNNFNLNNNNINFNNNSSNNNMNSCNIKINELENFDIRDYGFD